MIRSWVLAKARLLRPFEIQETPCSKPTTGPLVCTVLPTYNERDNIRPLIEGVLDSAVTPHIVLVVDDDSPDGTWQVVEAVAAERNRPGHDGRFSGAADHRIRADVGHPTRHR